MSPLSQTGEIVNGVSNAVANRSDSLVSALVLVAFVAWIMFQQNRVRKETDEQQAKREEQDKKRYDDQNQFHRDMAIRNADQLDLMATSLERTSKATEVMANCTKATETTLVSLTIAQRRDRKAIVSMIDAGEAKHRGEEEAAIKAIRDARNHLINGDEDHKV